ncbi:cation channel sperm-associated protein 4-like isoform X3 [Ascaphus truei]
MYYELFSVTEHIVLTVFIWEVLLKWFCGFQLFWKDGWNVFDLVTVVVLIVGPTIPGFGDSIFLRIFRVLRVVKLCTLIPGLSLMLQVIFRSVPEMGNIMSLLLIIMLVFSVFGVTMFGSLVPEYFDNIASCLYYLFTCVTLDGWLVVYSAFKEEGQEVQWGGALYLFLFITLGAFVLGNLLVAVVTTNLELAMLLYFGGEGTHLRRNESDGYQPREQEGEEPAVTLLHMEEIRGKTEFPQHQEPLSSQSLDGLSLETYENLCLVLEGIQLNLSKYRSLRDELDSLVDELRELKSNLEQEKEAEERSQWRSIISQHLLNNEIASGRKGDILSTLIALDKVNMTETEATSSNLYRRGTIKMGARKFRHQSQVNF